MKNGLFYRSDGKLENKGNMLNFLKVYGRLIES